MSSSISSTSSWSSFLIVSITFLAISFAITFLVDSGQFWSKLIDVLKVPSKSYHLPCLESSSTSSVAETMSSTDSYSVLDKWCSVMILIRLRATFICVSSSDSYNVFIAEDKTGSLSYQRLAFVVNSSFIKPPDNCD